MTAHMLGVGRNRGTAVAIDTECIHVMPLADDTAALAREDAAGPSILVSSRVSYRSHNDVALHMTHHLADAARAFGDTAARCARSTCPVAATWLPIVLTDVASGL